MPKAKTKSSNKTTPAAETVDDRVLTCEELLERIPVDRSTLWRMSREGRFPKPIQLTPSRIGWRWSAVLAWLADREANPVASRTYARLQASRAAFRKAKKAGTADEGPSTAA